jgi:16S rRNA (uracil1498-N3)-methyltransferase
VHPNGVASRFEAPRAAPSLSGTKVTLLACITKGTKVDEVIRSATALGVRRVVVVASARSVPILGRAEGDRTARWRAISLDAARQSGRGDLPRIEGPLSLAAALAEAPSSPAHKLCLDPRAEASLAHELAARAGRDPARELSLLVGPEGGLTDAEIAGATAAGFVAVRLGNLVLRAELAAVAALGAIVANDQP